MNPISVGLPFKEFVYGQQPLIMERAEYAIVEMKHNFIDVSFLCGMFNKVKNNTEEPSKTVTFNKQMNRASQLFLKSHSDKLVN